MEYVPITKIVRLLNQHLENYTPYNYEDLKDYLESKGYKQNTTLDDGFYESYNLEGYTDENKATVYLFTPDVLFERKLTIRVPM